MLHGPAGISPAWHDQQEELSLMAFEDRGPDRMQALAMIGLQIQDLAAGSGMHFGQRISCNSGT